MAKDLSVCVLLDFYGELLTKKQFEALDFYYNKDLSLSEISEQNGISPQGVRAFIKQGEAHLYEFEEKLHLKERFSKISKLSENAEELLSRMEPCEETEKMSGYVSEIKRQL